MFITDRIMKASLRVVTIFAVLLSTLGCAGGAQPKPQWTSAADVDIPAYSTFGWADGTRGPPVIILDNNIRNAVRAELLKKGYVEAAAAPDFVVDHETIEQETVQRSNPVRIGIGVGSRSGNVGGSVGTSVGVGGKESVSQQNRITIRAVDPRLNREVWAGTSTTLEEHPDANAVNRAVAGVMRGFPEKRN